MIFKYQEELLDTKDKIATFAPVVEIFQTTQNVYTKKIDELTLNLRADIKKEMEKSNIHRYDHPLLYFTDPAGKISG